MDKLEQYLQEVCRSIGGSRSMRQHVRQELREHLLDAASQHRTGGLSEEQALERALVEFGKPDEVRLELEATHGHRMMAVVIDKAIEWKEKTMRAKWLWTTWAYLALAAVLALEVFFLTFVVIFIVPKFQKLMRDGIIDRAILVEQDMTWMPSFLDELGIIGGGYTWLLILVPATLWGLFEWRMRSDNKPFMRLAALGTAATALMVLVMVTAGTLVISFCLGVPALGKMARPFALEQIAAVDTSFARLEAALAKKDWEGMPPDFERARSALSLLARGPGVTALANTNHTPTIDALRACVHEAADQLSQAQQAMARRDSGELVAALQKSRTALTPVQEAARKSDR